jgi:small conductance mechanosensitive channel
MDFFEDINYQSLQDKLLDFLVEFSIDLLIAVVILVIGIFVVRLVKRLIRKSFKKFKIEKSLATFVVSFTSFLLYAILIVTIGSTLGIKTSSFVAIIGAAGLAIGLALQGSLANFAGGVLVLVFKPFKVNDLIEINKKMGIVTQIDILYTRLVTFDHRMITIPNGTMANSDVVNWTMQDKRRIDLNLKLPYEANIKEVRQIVVNTLKKHPRVLKHPEPDFWLDAFGEYDMKIAARCWVKPEEYWPVYWEQLEAVKEALDKAGIRIPIPKSEVSLQK